MQLFLIPTSLSVSGTSNLGANVTTTGDQTYSGAAVLSANVILTTTSNGSVYFGGTIDGGYDLDITAHGTGDTTFNDAVGDSIALSDITIDTNEFTAAAMTAGNLNLTNSGTGGITGIIANASEVDTLALIKAGAGTLTLSANNTFTGDTTITTGTLTVTGTLADTTDVSVASGATYKLEVSDTIGSISGQGTVSVGDDFSFDAVVLTVDHSTAKTFSGNLIIPIGMEAHGFVKLGSGTLTFTTANTDADGDITVTGGVLSITHNEALGNTTTTVNSGAALHLSNNITVDAGIRLNGSGVSNNGALRSVSGSNTLTQWLLLETDTEIQVDSGSSLAISPTDHYSSAITGTYVGNNRHLTLDAQGTLGISKNINIGGKNLTKTASGTLTLSATNTYTGDTTISAGTLKLTGNLNSATDLVIDTGATLDLQAALTAATLT